MGPALAVLAVVVGMFLGAAIGQPILVLVSLLALIGWAYAGASDFFLVRGEGRSARPRANEGGPRPTRAEPPSAGDSIADRVGWHAENARLDFRPPVVVSDDDWTEERLFAARGF